MELATTRNPLSRIGILAVVVILHVIVITFRWSRPPLFTKESSALTLIDVERQLVTPPTRWKPPEPIALPARDQVFTPPSLPDLTIAPESTAISVPPIHWRESMDAAARAVTEKELREQGYRALGPRERRSDKTSSPGSVFEQPRRKAGDIDADPSGNALIWNNESCYTELKFPTIKDQNGIVGAPNPPKCMAPAGKRPARGDLFEEIERR